ncbi:hypothetical protein LCGC14_0879960 [marine sediment metagenome]|uniref:Ribbon-helix-helix protein CopG domain-containing protein n=1 Tax=marine sediment metagenome TaxID=412755 RepID=A0A0F9P753_9ZZZZ|nr:hypothetical protein [Candidatus Aminicenantes bacterium]
MADKIIPFKQRITGACFREIDLTKKEKTKVFTIRIPTDWHKKLLEIAEEECRTQNSVAKQAIKEFLEKNKALKLIHKNRGD